LLLCAWASGLLTACVAKDCPAGAAQMNGKCLSSSTSGASGDKRHDAMVGAPPAEMDEAKGDAGEKDAALPLIDASAKKEIDAGSAAMSGKDAAASDAATVMLVDAGKPAPVDAGPCDGGDLIVCWRDSDGDGYAAKTASMKRFCASECADG